MDGAWLLYGEAGSGSIGPILAAALPPAAMRRDLGTTLRASPPLFNRDYLHLIWQNSLMAATTYWRLMYSRNLNDDSGELAVYSEHYITGRLSCFVLAVANNGGNRQEFGQFIDGNVLLGLRLAIP